MSLPAHFHLNTGGAKEWRSAHVDCPRCHHRCTWYGWTQAWYDTVWICGRCGATGTADEGVRWGSPAADRKRALSARAGFVRWLLAGSPKLTLP